MAFSPEGAVAEASFYESGKVGSLYSPNTAAAVEAGKRASLPPVERDERRLILLLVDPQVDFIHPDGALSVPGAVDDTRRTIEWILRHTPRITAIATSLDSHIPNQIFFPTWWADREGRAPKPLTPIAKEDLELDRWRPVFEPEWSKEYVRRLEEEARKALMIWPFHTMIGTPGHSVAPALYEAIAYHAAARRSQPTFLTKGTLPKSEYYSLLEPEVPVPDEPLGGLNESFLHHLLSYERIFIAGQAKSHCVLETLTSIMRRYGDDSGVTSKLHVLADCTSSVRHPEIDFDAMADEVLGRFRAKGVKLVTSRDPVG